MTPNLMIWATFLSGFAMATFGACGVFFLKLWRTSHDRFFLGFAVACWLLSFERLCGVFVSSTMESLRVNVSEASSWIYVIRLFAFLTILIVVIDKNRSQKKD
jgi:hypothetical protein